MIGATKPTRDLCIMACIFCKEPEFLKWVDVMAAQAGYDVDIPADEAFAKTFITTLCQVTSRNDLDRDPAAAERFHDLVRKPFLQWKEDVASAYSYDGTIGGAP